MQQNSEFEYDYLIVGSGLFGSVFAYEATKRGYRCLVLEKRAHLGGNVYCETIDSIITHKYGAHIFHTNDERIWKYVNSFVSFEPYEHFVKVKVGDKYYSFPFNVETFKQLWGVNSESEALQRFKSVTSSKSVYINLAEKGETELGKDLFALFVRGYTEKQWGRSCEELPASILARIPIREQVQETYFTDTYQGLPKGGYNVLIESMLKDVECIVNVDFLDKQMEWESKARKIVFTGCLDALFGNRFGKLDYRSLRFENEKMNMAYFQPVSVVNYPEKEIPFTRIIEHKYFHPIDCKHTLITREYPEEYDGTNEPYYPVVDKENKDKYKKYRGLVDDKKYIIGGRLAEFKYYEMQQVIASALTIVQKEFGREG